MATLTAQGGLIRDHNAERVIGTAGTFIHTPDATYTHPAQGGIVRVIGAVGNNELGSGGGGTPPSGNYFNSRIAS